MLFIFHIIFYSLMSNTLWLDQFSINVHVNFLCVVINWKYLSGKRKHLANFVFKSKISADKAQETESILIYQRMCTLQFPFTLFVHFVNSSVLIELNGCKSFVTLKTRIHKVCHNFILFSSGRAKHNFRRHTNTIVIL